VLFHVHWASNVTYPRWAQIYLFDYCLSVLTVIYFWDSLLQTRWPGTFSPFVVIRPICASLCFSRFSASNIAHQTYASSRDSLHQPITLFANHSGREAFRNRLSPIGWLNGDMD